MRSYKSLDDQELCSLLRDNDELAYTEIYNRYWKIIYAICYNRLRNMEVAQDLVHDTFANLWLTRERTTIENLKSYLAIAVKYRVIEHVRREKLQSDYANTSIVPIDNHAIDDSIHLKHVLSLLNKEIENLPEKCKLIFKYSREQNMSGKAIAKDLSISVSTVENQINKALSKLKVVLKNFNSFLF